MKQQIDHLIANTLLDEESVYLPNIGTLILFRHPAKRLSSKRLQIPYREVQLKSEEVGKNIVSLISKTANVSEERAKDIYAEWLEQSQRDGATTISTVCNIANGVVFTISSFEALVNPNGRGETKINPNTNRLIYIIVGLGLGIVLGATTALLLFNSSFKTQSDKEEKSSSTVQVETTEATPIEQNEQQTIEIGEQQTVEQSTEPTAEPTVTDCEKAAAGPFPKLQEGKSYAVWGVYDELKNAERYHLWLMEKYPKVKAEIYYYDSRYMVALCVKPSRKECNKQVAAWKKRYKGFKDVWVYTR